MYKINRLQWAFGCLLSFLPLLQVPHFMPYFMHTNNADSRRCTRGWSAPCHLLAAQSLTLNIAQKQVIAHVEGVDAISVRRIFIFHLCSRNNVIQDVSCLCSRHSSIWGVFSFPAECFSVHASTLPVRFSDMENLTLSWGRELWCEFTDGYWLPRSFLLVWNNSCHWSLLVMTGCFCDTDL